MLHNKLHPLALSVSFSLLQSRRVDASHSSHASPVRQLLRLLHQAVQQTSLLGAYSHIFSLNQTVRRLYLTHYIKIYINIYEIVWISMISLNSFFVFPIFPLLSVCLAFSWSLLLEFSLCVDMCGHVQTLTLGEEGPFLSAASRAGEALGAKVKTEREVHTT